MSTCFKASLPDQKLIAVLISKGFKPTLRRTSALVTEWSQNCGHLDKLSGWPTRELSWFWKGWRRRFNSVPGHHHS